MTEIVFDPITRRGKLHVALLNQHQMRYAFVLLTKEDKKTMDNWIIANLNSGWYSWSATVGNHTHLVLHYQ